MRTGHPPTRTHQNAPERQNKTDVLPLSLYAHSLALSLSLASLTQRSQTGIRDTELQLLIGGSHKAASRYMIKHTLHWAHGIVQHSMPLTVHHDIVSQPVSPTCSALALSASSEDLTTLALDPRRNLGRDAAWWHAVMPRTVTPRASR